jgi:hypothetical protein
MVKIVASRPLATQCEIGAESFQMIARDLPPPCAQGFGFSVRNAFFRFPAPDVRRFDPFPRFTDGFRWNGQNIVVCISRFLSSQFARKVLGG